MLGFLASGLSSGLQAGISGLQTVFGFLTTAFRFVAGQVMNFGGLLLRAGALIAGVVVGALTAFGAAIVSSTKAAMEYSRTIIDLRNSTGMNTGMAQGIAQRFGAFGIGAGALGNGGQYHGITSLTGRVYGVNPYDPQSINARSQSFGSGFMGFQMRQSMLSGIGMNNPQGQFLANLPTAKVNAQAAFQQDATARMGVSPETTRRLAEDLPLVIARFEVLRDLLFNKIASAALPYLESALTKAADFLSANGETIANGIGLAVEMFTNGLTMLGDFLIANSGTITNAIYSVVSWLYADAPVLVLQGLQTLIKAGMGFVAFFADLAHSIANQLRLFDQSQGALYNTVVSIATVFDNVLNVFRDFGAGLATAGALFHDGLVASLMMVAGPLAPIIAKKIGLDMTLQNPVTAARDFYNSHPASNIAGMMPNLQNGTATKWANALDSGANAAQDFSQKHGSTAIAFLQKQLDALGPRDQRRAEFQAMIAELQKSNVIAEKVAANTEKTADRITGFGDKTAARVLAYIAEDTALANFAG